VRLFNKVKEGKDFPTYWKIAIVYQIFEVKGKIREPGNYRGIVLLSALGNIYSGRLRDWLINNRILSKFQAGFVINNRKTNNIFHNRQIFKGKKRAYLLVYGGPRKSIRFNTWGSTLF
jgi:hypothetical protein